MSNDLINEQLSFGGKKGKQLLETFLNVEQQSYISDDKEYGKYLKTKYSELKAKASKQTKKAR